MSYQDELTSSVNSVLSRLDNAESDIISVQTLSNNTKIIRGTDYPNDYLSLFGAEIDNTWHRYPLSNFMFKVDTDYPVLITTDLRISSYGVLVQVDHFISSIGYSVIPTNDSGFFLDRRFGGTRIMSISRRQFTQSHILPKGEYSLNMMMRPLSDTPSSPSGLCGISDVVIGVRGL